MRVTFKTMLGSTGINRAVPLVVVMSSSSLAGLEMTWSELSLMNIQDSTELTGYLVTLGGHPALGLLGVNFSAASGKVVH